MGGDYRRSGLVRDRPVSRVARSTCPCQSDAVEGISATATQG